MKLLALDTSSVACSVALQVMDEVTELHEEQPREHTRLLVPMIRALLDAAELATSELDAIVLGNGPGSFIGMRIAASVAQGLAFGSGLRIVTVSSLAAIAAQVFEEYRHQEAVVAQDAHMNQVYLGIFGRNESGLPVARIDERLHEQGLIEELEGVASDTRVAAGFGWQRYPALLAANRDLLGETADILHPRARYLLPSGADAVRNGRTIDPKELVPAYLRHKVARPPAP